MRKCILIIVVLLSIGASLNAQNKYKPYASVGISVFDKVVSPGAEVGIYNDNNWFGLGYSNTLGESYGSLRAYRRLYTAGLLQQYLWAGANLHLGAAASFPLSRELLSFLM